MYENAGVVLTVYSIASMGHPPLFRLHRDWAGCRSGLASKGGCREIVLERIECAGHGGAGTGDESSGTC